MQLLTAHLFGLNAFVPVTTRLTGPAGLAGGPDPDPFRGIRPTPPLQPLRSLPIWFWTSEMMKDGAVLVISPHLQKVPLPP